MIKVICPDSSAKSCLQQQKKSGITIPYLKKDAINDVFVNKSGNVPKKNLLLSKFDNLMANNLHFTGTSTTSDKGRSDLIKYIRKELAKDHFEDMDLKPITESPYFFDVNPNICNNDGQTGFMVAAFLGDEEAVVEKYLRHKETIIGLKDEAYGNNAAEFADLNQHFQLAMIIDLAEEFVDALHNKPFEEMSFAGIEENRLFNRINIDRQNKNGDTAFMAAVREGYIPTIQAFLDHPDNDIEVTNNDGKKAIDFTNDEQIIDLINQEKYLKKQDLIKIVNKDAINNEDLSAIAKIADMECFPEINVNFRNRNNGNTIFIDLVESGQTELAKKFLENPTLNAKIKNHQNKSALDYANEKGLTEVAELIEKRIIEDDEKASAKNNNEALETLINQYMGFVNDGERKYVVTRQESDPTKYDTVIEREMFNFAEGYPRGLCDIGGMSLEKDAIIKNLLKPLAEMGQDSFNGYLLVGPQYTGKTFFCEAVASETGLPMYKLTDEHIKDKETLNSIFDQLQTKYDKTGEPSILFIEKFENIQQNRILIDKLKNADRRGIIVMATSSAPNKLNNEIARTALFNTVINVSLPDLKDRKDICRVIFRNEPFAEDVLKPQNLSKLAKETAGFSPADIAVVANRAIMERTGDDLITLKDVRKQIEEQANVRGINREYFENNTTYEYDTYVSRYIPKHWEPKSFKDVGGMEDTKEALRKYIINPLKSIKGSKGYAQNKKIMIPSGVVIAGPEECGKSFIALAAAAEAGIPVYKLSSIDFNDESHLNKIINQLKFKYDKSPEHEPSIILIDEIESTGLNKSINNSFDKFDMLKKLVNHSSANGIFVIGTTNYYDAIDKKLLSSSKLCNLIKVDKPKIESRKDIIKVLLAKEKSNAAKALSKSDGDISEIAAKMADLSNGDIARIINDAMYNAKANKTKINKDIIFDSLSEFKKAEKAKEGYTDYDGIAYQ